MSPFMLKQAHDAMCASQCTDHAGEGCTLTHHCWCPDGGLSYAEYNEKHTNRRLSDDALFAVEISVRAERERAHEKHGAKGNSREDQPWDEREWLPILVEEVGEVAHCLTYDADPDPRELRKELIQVAAMACAWIAAIDEFVQ